MTTEHHHLEVDGVAVHHFPSADVVTSAVLTFAVGLRNESLATGGALHLLEHLVMGAARRTPIEFNASVDPSLTEFRAKGSPEHVAAFLQTVCRQLSDPPTDRLAAEVRVLEAEEHSDGDGSGSDLSLVRYGWRDLGLVGGPVAGTGGVSAETVRAVAATWFVSGNAVLIVDGPWPPELRLPLPRGDRPVKPPISIMGFARPHAVVTDDASVCGVSLMLPASDDHRELVAGTVLRRRLEELLRHRDGLVYDLDHSMTASGDGRWDLQIYAVPAPHHLRQTVQTMVPAVLSLLRSGATAEELADARELAVEEARGRAAEIGFVLDGEISRLLGSPVPPFDPQAVVDVDHRSFADYLRRAADDVVFLVGDDAAADLDGLGLAEWPGPGVAGPLPQGEEFRPGLLAQALHREARDSRIALLDGAIAHRIDGIVQTIPWSQVAGVMRLAGEDGMVVVFGLDGSSVTVGPRLYRHGGRLVEALQRHLPAELFYDEPPEPGARP